MRLTRLLPAADGHWNADDEGLHAALAELYRTPTADGRHIRINMISSLNGSAVGSDGTSETLSNRMDRAILKTIRAEADVVVVGARTVRREGYLGPSASTLAIVTLSGDLEGHRLQKSSRPPLVLRPDSAASRVTAQLADIPHQAVSLDSGHLDAPTIVAALEEHGFRRIVCEGGPTLATSFLESDLVDELCLTVAPQLHSPGIPMFADLPRTIDAELVQLLADSTGTLYGRWRVGTHDSVR